MEWTHDELLKLAQEHIAQKEVDAEHNVSSDMIQVVMVEPMKEPYKETILNDLTVFQKIVNGYIEIMTIGKTETGGFLAMTMNEEGKLLNLPFNKRIVRTKDTDMIVGTFFITAYNTDGENVSLSDEMCEKLIKKFKRLEVYL